MCCVHWQAAPVKTAIGPPLWVKPGLSAPISSVQNSLAIGETSIFKVGGAMAKASKRDVPSPTLYRIKLGTHAHFINYMLY
uniref:HDC14431 n=1 Tax=Drosophila melanogaster TaxID=7227 RepID=Q6IJQ8_DROME|nr:TPA_inf: HDC14431 [Drosophila melanogaster]